MATTVVKGAGRARQAANVRHQQRTPLPARNARSVVVEHQAALVQAAAPAISKPAAFAKAAEAHGWKVTKIIEPISGDLDAPRTKTVRCERGAELLTISWFSRTLQPGSEVFQPDSAVHGFAGQAARKVRNAAEGYRLLAVPAAEALVASQHAKRPAPRKSAATPKSGPRRKLPFDPATATDKEVLEAVHGRRVTWYNELTEDFESARVPDDTWELRERTVDGKKQSYQVQVSGRQTKIEESRREPNLGRRILTFCDADGGGYRSLYVDCLERVS